MENALLIGLSRQVALSRELDVVANNVANIDTNGFKRRGTVFEEFIMPVARGEEFRPADRQVSFVVDRGTSLAYTPGNLERTGNALDVAISGNAMLVVQTNVGRGERYTRNGALAINGRGELVTSDGLKVLTDQGPVTLNPTETDLKIAADGSISSSVGPKGKLRMVAVPNPQLLRSEGQNVFSTAAPLRPADPKDARLEIGAIEKSNVRPVLEIARLMELNRSYSSIASLMQRTDETRRNAINKLADVGN
jgi:flagellar basal-body rod protein FlgF